MSQDNLGSVEPRYRALCMLSGGLDSQLAICVLKAQGIDVIAVTFDSPFFAPAKAIKAAEVLDVQLELIDFTSDIVSLLHSPKHGFGKNMNPCIDCHALMMKRTGELLEPLNAHFIATGEVMQQRPKSQNPRALGIVAAESGLAGLILRPLSAKLMTETIPEQKGWVDRERLYDIQGRTRERQIKLAEEMGLTDYPSPGGGCRLTDPNFSIRLRDLRDHEGFAGAQSLELLRVGRHFRMGPKIKFILGRHQADNVKLEGMAELYDLVFTTTDVPGPTGTLPFTAREAQIELAAAICARYSDVPRDQPASVRVRSARGVRELKVTPATDEEIEKIRI